MLAIQPGSIAIRVCLLQSVGRRSNSVTPTFYGIYTHYFCPVQAVESPRYSSINQIRSKAIVAGFQKHKIFTTYLSNMSATQICPDCGLVHNGEHVFCPFFKGEPMPYKPRPGLKPRPQQPKPEEKQSGDDEKQTQYQRQRKPREWECGN